MPTVLREAAGGVEMALDKDVEIRLSDGAVLRADVYRPKPDGKYPALMTYGPYGKDSHISQFMGDGWNKLKGRHPEMVANSTGKHMVFERPDPEVVGAARLRRRPGRLPRRRPLARQARRQLAAGVQGFRRGDRVGRGAALVQRQGRALGHFLLRGRPVDGRVLQAEISCRHPAVGRHLRFLPRPHAPRRHLLRRVRRALVAEQRAQ